jgi:hypothetical protein
MTHPLHARLETSFASKNSVYPFTGLLAVVGSTFVALTMIPSDYQTEGALCSPATVMASGFLLAPVLSSARAAKNFFRVEHLLMFGLVYWLLIDLIQGAYGLSGATIGGVEQALLSIGIFAAGIWIGVMLPAARPPGFVLESTRLELTPEAVFSVTIVFFCLTMFNFLLACQFDVVLMFASLSKNRWATPWAAEEMGSWSSFRDHLAYFGYVLPTLTTLHALKRGWRHPASIISVAMTVTVLAFLSQSGGRRIIGVTVGAAILFWLLTRPHLKTSQLFLGALAVVTLLVFMQLMLEYRNVGVDRILTNDEIRISTTHLHIDDNFLRLAQTIDLVPESYPYVYEKRLLYTLARPIPRVFWKDKPTNYGFNLARSVTNQMVTLSASVIADWYIMGGLGVIFFGGVFYGCLAAMWNRLRELKNNVAATLSYSLGCMAVFTSLRSLDELVLQSYMLFAWIGISLLLLRVQNNAT